MDKVRIFISYAREDEFAVRQLYQKLSDAGFRPWMDKIDLLPGEEWQSAIEKALRDADFLIICLSSASVQKRGFVQREFKTALDLWQEKLREDIYLIPVRLEYCEPPRELGKFQWLDLFEEENEWPRLIKALQTGMQRRGKTPDIDTKPKPGPEQLTRLMPEDRPQTLRAIVLIYGFLVGAGGAMGYAKASSMPSLIAGGVSGIALVGSAIAMKGAYSAGWWISLIVALLLLGRFGIVALSKGFDMMPGGLVIILSIIVIAALLTHRAQ